jgi:hypothetical protein
MRKVIGVVAMVTAVTLAACTGSAAPTTTTAGADHDHAGTISANDLVAVSRATAAFQDVAGAEAAGYASTMDGLGCFHNPGTGGMGLHYLKESLLDDVLDPTQPEALVYELGANGEIVGLVAHEYIVPVDAWSGDSPPSVLGKELHQHPVLPLWVLHAWIWKHNPAGFFEDWNPAVRLCPEGVPIFGS